MWRRLFVALLVLAPVTVFTQTKAPSVEGVWQITSVVTTGAGALNNRKAQPGLLIFARSHYSWVSVNGTAPRPKFAAAKDPNKLTDAEGRAVRAMESVDGQLRHLSDQRQHDHPPSDGGEERRRHDDRSAAGGAVQDRRQQADAGREVVAGSARERDDDDLDARGVSEVGAQFSSPTGSSVDRRKIGEAKSAVLRRSRPARE